MPRRSRPVPTAEARAVTTAAIKARGELVRTQATAPKATASATPSKKPVRIHRSSLPPNIGISNPLPVEDEVREVFGVPTDGCVLAEAAA